MDSGGLSPRECREVLDLVRRRKWRELAETDAAGKLAALAARYLGPAESWDRADTALKGQCIGRLCEETILEDLKAPEGDDNPAGFTYSILKTAYVERRPHTRVMERLGVPPKGAKYYTELLPEAVERLCLALRKRLQDQAAGNEEPSETGAGFGQSRVAGASLPLPRCRRLWGRDADIQEVARRLSDPDAPPMCGLFAFGGFGKTELARAVAARLVEDSDFDDVVWLTFREEEFLPHLEEAVAARRRRRWGTPEEVLSALAAKLGGAPADLAEALREERYVLVLDNFETAPSQGRLLGRLVGVLGAGRALVTSRRRVLAPFVEDFTVRGLDREATLSLIRWEAGARNQRQLLDASDSLLDRIYRATRGAPLALHLIVAQASFMEVERLLASLKGVRGPNKAFYSFLLRDAWTRLPPEARSLLIYMGTTADAALEREELQRAELMEEGDLDAALLELNAWSMVDTQEEPGTGKMCYDLHPLTRAFVRSDLREEWQTQWEDYAGRAIDARLQRLRRG